MILSEKRILIVGARNRRSLAYACAVSARAQGAKLAFSTQPVGDKAYDKTAAILNEDFPDAPVFSCDAANDADIAAAVDNAAKALGGLDGLVHAIAFAQRETLSGRYHENLTRPAFCEAMDISAYTLAAFTKSALPHMTSGGCTASGGGGGIVALTYLGAERAMPNYNVMGVAKAALEASVRYLAYGVGDGGVRVNAVSAGPVKTLAAAAIGDFGKILNQVEEKAPLKRNITAAEVGDATAFLLSDMARGITGEVVHVDAGFHITAGF